MAQYDFGTIDPNTKSGTALATDLNSWRNALHSTHGGSSAPSYITAGMLWVDTTSADYELKLYDGAQSIPVAVIDATNNVARVAVDPAETSYITSTTSGQIRHVIASTDVFTTRSTGIQFNLASPVISDSNNNELLEFTTTASAVNQLSIANSATGGAVQLSTVGSDTNINIALMPKGTGNVGIGTATPIAKLTVSMDTASLSVGNLSTDVAQIGVSSVSDSIAFGQFVGGGATFDEKARVDSSGTLLVGMTSSSASSDGCRIFPTGVMTATRESNATAVFNRKTTEGSIVELKSDNTVIGDIGVTSSRVFIASDNGSTGSGILFGSGGPVATDRTGTLDDNAYDVGSLNVRWDDIYATNGTIQTSDRNEKQDIEELSEAERRVAVACKGLMRKYRWKDAVAEKGDEARIHFGIIAQDLQAAFAAEGLDAGRYAMFISSTWWEMDEVVPATETEPERTVKKIYDTAEEAPEGATERTRLGVRYPELLAFMISVL